MKEFIRRNPRIGGLILLLISGGFAKFTILDVVAAAKAHVDSGVNLYMKGIFVCGVCFIFGTIMLLFGQVGHSWLQPIPGTKRVSPAGWIIVFLVCGLSFAFYFWFKMYLESLGYTF